MGDLTKLALDAVKLLNAGKSTGSFAYKAKNMANMFSLPSFHPAIGEGVIGGALGGAYGAAKDEDPSTRGMSIAKGVGLGMLGGIGLGAIGRAGLKQTDKVINDINKVTRDGANRVMFGEDGTGTGPDAIQNFVGNKLGVHEENLYEDVFSRRTNLRKSVGYKVKGRLELGNYKDGMTARDKYKNLKHVLRNTDDYADYTSTGYSMAPGMADDAKLKNFTDSYANIPAVDMHTKYKDKVFGGLRSTLESSRLQMKSVTDRNDMIHGVTDMTNRIDGKGFHFNMFPNSPKTISDVSDVESLMKTPEFKNRYNAATRGATKDFRKGTHGAYFDHAAQAKQDAVSDINLDQHASNLGIDMGAFSTKKQVDKHIKNQMRTYHPDVAVDKVNAEAKFKDVNAASSGIKGSAWYSKLASLVIEDRVRCLHEHTIKDS